MFKSMNPKLSIVGDREFRLEDDVVYTGKCGDFTVPAGFRTDFASVPRVVQWLIPSYGRYTLAAIVHDWLCVDLKRYYNEVSHYLDAMSHLWPNPGHPAPPVASSRDTDGIFRRIMRELGVPFLRRWVMWTGVRWGALGNPARRKGIAKDLLPMILWSIIAAPVVVPATLVVGAGLLIDKIFEALIGRFLK